MAPLEALRRDVLDERFRLALVLGLASIPFTVGVNWLLSPDPVSATPVGIACVIAGYAARSRSVAGTRAGAVTGLVGGVPIVVWQSWIALSDWWNHPTVVDAVGDAWAMAAATGAAVVTAVVLAAILALVGAVGGFVGDWVNRRFDPARAVGGKS